MKRKGKNEQSQAEESGYPLLRARLSIGRRYIEWRYNQPLPTIAALLFRGSDFILKRLPRKPAETPYAYRTTAARALRMLDSLGYTPDAFLGVPSAFEKEVTAEYDLALRFEYTWRKRSRRAFRMPPDPEMPVKARFAILSKYLGALLPTLSVTPDTPRRIGVGAQRFAVVRASEYRYFLDQWEIDWDTLSECFLSRIMTLPRGLVSLALVLSESRVAEFPEVLLLFFLRLYLQACPPRTSVILDLEDLCLDEDQARSLHSFLNSRLIEKVNLYRDLFLSQDRGSDELRLRFLKEEVGRLVEHCDRARSRAQKGRALEELANLIFSFESGLHVTERRVRLESCEVDLVVKNKVHDPFWMSLRSPLFLVECKNWAERVGAGEFRKFFTALEDQNLSHGFLLAINGFTSEALSWRRRLPQRARIIPLDRKAIDHFRSSRESVREWLEGHLSRLL